MLQHEIKRRVSYGETDKMGYLYYGHYAHYYEIGRVEFLRDLGMAYKSLEDDYKVMLPVKSLNMRFVRPGKYDDLVTIRTMLSEFSETGIAFKVELFNEAGKIMNAGEVRLAFVDSETMRGCPPPKDLVDLIGNRRKEKGE
jgi:acyl-CoA thioester hydrolase